MKTEDPKPPPFFSFRLNPVRYAHDDATRTEPLVVLSGVRARSEQSQCLCMHMLGDFALSVCFPFALTHRADLLAFRGIAEGHMVVQTLIYK